MIEINQLEFTHTKTQSTACLRIPKWQLGTGEQLFLQGPSGCGKSTLLNILCGRLRPQSGELNILGRPLNIMSTRALDRFRAANMGVIFQQFNLIPYLTSLENLVLAQGFSKARPNKPSNAAQGKSLLEALHIPQPLWHKPVSTLSIGQQQRVAIARALAHQPKLILADEPTSALDQAQRDNFIKLLTQYCTHTATAIVFVSHDVSLAPFFTRQQCFSDINHSQ